MPPTEIETERMYPGSIIREAEGVRFLGSKMATPLEELVMAGAWGAKGGLEKEVVILY